MKIIRFHDFLGKKVCLNLVNAGNSCLDGVTLVAIFRRSLLLDSSGGYFAVVLCFPECEMSDLTKTFVEHRGQIFQRVDLLLMKLS